jgi:hypothetical protein
LPLFELFKTVGPVAVPVLVTVRVPRAPARPPVSPGLTTPRKLLWALSEVVPPTVEDPGMVVGPMVLVPVLRPPDIELPDTLPVGLMIPPILKPMPLDAPFIVTVPIPAGIDPPLFVLPIKEEPPERIPS